MLTALVREVTSRYLDGTLLGLIHNHLSCCGHSFEFATFRALDSRASVIFCLSIETVATSIANLFIFLATGFQILFLTVVEMFVGS